MNTATTSNTSGGNVPPRTRRNAREAAGLAGALADAGDMREPSAVAALAFLAGSGAFRRNCAKRTAGIAIAGVARRG